MLNSKAKIISTTRIFHTAHFLFSIWLKMDIDITIWSDHFCSKFFPSLVTIMVHRQYHKQLQGKNGISLRSLFGYPVWIQYHGKFGIKFNPKNMCTPMRNNKSHRVFICIFYILGSYSVSIPVPYSNDSMEILQCFFQLCLNFYYHYALDKSTENTKLL